VKTNAKIFGLGLSVLAAGSLAACTTEQEQSVLNTLNTLCSAAPTFVTVVSSLTGASAFAGTLGTGAGVACDQGVKLVQDAIDAITAAGGTASVSVTSSDPSAAKSLKKMAAKYGVPVKTAGKTITFQVPPSTGLFGL